MQVYAFVGKTGTGKSYNALKVAKSHDIKYIIDDAILIKETKVIAGKSAKTEASKIASVKAAIFLDENRRKEMAKVIKKEKIDIEEDGTVYVSGVEQEKLDKAISIIESLTRDVELNEVYLGKVTKILQFGALVEILPGKEGLLHISKISKERVNKVEDVLNVGDEILVKVIEMNKEDGKFSLSAKDAMKV